MLGKSKLGQLLLYQFREARNRLSLQLTNTPVDTWKRNSKLVQLVGQSDAAQMVRYLLNDGAQKKSIELMWDSPIFEDPSPSSPYEQRRVRDDRSPVGHSSSTYIWATQPLERIPRVVRRALFFEP